METKQAVQALSALAQDRPKAELFGGYSFLNTNDLVELNLNGWNASMAANVNDWLGIAADFSGHYGKPSFFGFVPTSGLSTNVHSFLFGPRVTYRGHSNVIPFGHALFGVSRGYANIFGVNYSDSSFAMAFGGGVDFKLSDRVAIRMIQADYVQTRLASDRQNNARLSAGIVFRIGSE